MASHDVPDSTTPDVAPLLRAVASGDRVAFERLYQAASPRLFGICMRVLGNRDDAEDVLQEVFVSIWHKAGQFDNSRASAMPWLAMIARNRAIDRLRQRPEIAHAPIEEQPELADHGPSPATINEQWQDNARLGECLEQLESDRRRLLRQAFFDGLTYDELARRIGSPLGTVKSWIRRSLLQLRACLEPA